MIKELRCQNYKAFGEETQFSLSDLTVLVGPNNAGKSTALDLARLTESGHAVNLTSGRGRLRRFDALLTDEANSLTIGRRFSADVTLRPGGTDLPTFHLADDLSFESTFEPFGDGYLLTRRDVFMHPHGESTRRRIASRSVEVGPAKRVDAKPARPHPDLDDILGDHLLGIGGVDDDSDEETAAPVPDELWFGLSESGQSGSIQEERPKGRSQKRRAMMSPTGPYKREILIDHFLDESLVELAFSVANALRRLSRKKDALGLSAGSLSFSQKDTVSVNSEEEPPPLQPYPLNLIVKQGLQSPSWIPSDKEKIWRALRAQILIPLVEEIEEAFGQADVTHLPSFRARPERYYGPQDPMTPLLKKYQDAHPTVKDDVEGWLDTFELGSDLTVETVAPGLYAASVRRNGARRYLADLGSGTAQLLPLVLKLTVGSPSGVVLLEEPEANLHPNLQSRLADLLVELIDEGHQVLVETHSEYFVRRLQYLVARGKCDSDSTSVLYVDGVEDGETKTPNVRAISIDEHGQLSEPFGSGFFDEATDLMVDLFKYGSEN